MVASQVDRKQIRAATISLSLYLVILGKKRKLLGRENFGEKKILRIKTIF